MKKVGIVLIVLQLIGVFCGIMNGTLREMFTFSGMSFYQICEIIGFFLIGIIGVILWLKAPAKKGNAQKRICCNCKAVLPENAEFCASCGTRQRINVVKSPEV